MNTISKTEAKRIALDTFARLANGEGQVALHAAYGLLNYAVSPQYGVALPPLPSSASDESEKEGD